MSSKRDLILAATQELLSKHGFHGFSMKQLADTAGVAAGSIYNHFENKEDLILQLHLQILTDIASYTFASYDDKATLFAQYQHFWLQFWNYCLDHPTAVLCKDQFDHLPPKQKAVQSEKIMQLFEPLTRFFEAGKSQKVFKDLDNEVLSVLSLETSSVLARLQLMQQINLTEENIKEVIEASWHSISK
ncbi:TetR/AcrR family transcriptional regulator [Marinicella rhabdoformis]|uniref:TetR/AcrR family transcriptional regulator n=1 Tax=Marinicella rhabdoformis TaxID=2580566 RepID=UPI0012AEBD29|nr:TetR/AcrR family transcriptional regulator [Marinicella rhabdoformis]